MNSLPRLTRISASLALIFALAACGGKSDAPAAPPPPEVSVITVNPTKLAVTNELPARLESSRIAEVRARVPGIILKRNFHEGSDVKAGELLYQIDPAQFRADYNSANAAVERAEAILLQNELKAKRYKPLVETNAISKQEYDDVVAAEKQAKADLAAAKATRENARLSLGYANVTSPISGRIGRALVTEGALVGQNEATPLAVVQQIDPIYVNMTQSSTDILKLQRAMAEGQLKSTGKDEVKITLLTEDGQEYPHTGKLLFSDLTVDETSGAVALRAQFPNPDRTLLPGMYIRARVEQAVNESALAVPQRAVMQTPAGAAVMVVDAENKVVSRPIKTGSSHDNSWIVESGLQAGDRVIVEGLQKVQPGAVVKPVSWQTASSSDAAATTEQSEPAAPADKAAQPATK